MAACMLLLYYYTVKILTQRSPTPPNVQDIHASNMPNLCTRRGRGGGHQILLSTKNWASSVDTVTWLRAGRPRNLSSIPGGTKQLFSMKRLEEFRNPPSLLFGGWRGLFPSLKRMGREACHSFPPSAQVQNTWSYTSIPPYVCVKWCLLKQRDNFNVFPLSLSLRMLSECLRFAALPSYFCPSLPAIPSRSQPLASALPTALSVWSLNRLRYGGMYVYVPRG